jgi:hypothetical protein
VTQISELTKPRTNVPASPHTHFLSTARVLSGKGPNDFTAHTENLTPERPLYLSAVVFSPPEMTFVTLPFLQSTVYVGGS